MIANVYHESGVATESLEAITVGLRAISLVVGGVGGLQPRTGDLGNKILPTHNDSQVDASRSLTVLNPWERSELQLLVTHRDLGAAGLNFCYGVSRAGSGIVVMSTARLAGDSVAIAGLTVHEAGHAFGLVRQDASNYDAGSAFPGHCVNDCVMQAVNDKTDMTRAAEQLALSINTAGFCGNCALELSKVHFA